jgi:hypothetical protein
MRFFGPVTAAAAALARLAIMLLDSIRNFFMYHVN